MPDWRIEQGIGEDRAVLLQNGEIIEARIALEGSIAAGSILEARLIDCGMKGRNAIAVTKDGSEFLLPQGAAGVTEGARLSIEVTRPTIPGPEPWKRPLARVTNKPPRLSEPLADLGGDVTAASARRDELSNAGWDEIIEEARSSEVRFAGGELRLSLTPAMTLIDVDGYLESPELAVRGAASAARAIRRLDIGGSIGIDLPTVGSRSVRLAAAEAIDHLLPQPFERTAMNGFGFIQIIRPRTRPSLLELAADAALFETRALLRRIARDGVGRRTIIAHPAVVRTLEEHPAWLHSLSRQLGGAVGLRADAKLPMSAGYAEQA